jgi:hypothetical protein
VVLVLLLLLLHSAATAQHASASSVPASTLLACTHMQLLFMPLLLQVWGGSGPDLTLLTWHKHATQLQQRLLTKHGMYCCCCCCCCRYGAYGSKQWPSFNPADLALLDRGLLLAVAHVRGGGELGSAWHVHGKKFSKVSGKFTGKNHHACSCGPCCIHLANEAR